ncbi:hypothetical protein MRX96_004533 [Rhipicephalus microplus]
MLRLLGLDQVAPMQASSRVVRWALKLAAYSYQFVCHLGKDLGPADVKSRLPLPQLPAVVPESDEVLVLEHAYPEVCTKLVMKSSITMALNVATPTENTLPTILGTEKKPVGLLESSDGSGSQKWQQCWPKAPRWQRNAGEHPLNMVDVEASYADAYFRGTGQGLYDISARLPDGDARIIKIVSADSVVDCGSPSFP